MSEPRWCEDCAGGAERCEREGHLLGGRTQEGGNVVRYTCRRCDWVVTVPSCTGCGRDLFQARITPLVAP